MHTPFFPLLRPRLAALGRRVQHLRQQSLCHLELLLGPLLPPGLLAQADEGPNSRERVYTLRRTFFGFLYQVLNPECPCREIVRQIQAPETTSRWIESASKARSTRCDNSAWPLPRLAQKPSRSA